MIHGKEARQKRKKGSSHPPCIDNKENRTAQRSGQIIRGAGFLHTSRAVKESHDAFHDGKICPLLPAVPGEEGGRHLTSGKICIQVYGWSACNLLLVHGINEVRSRLEGLHGKSPIFQGGKKSRRHSRLSAPALRSRKQDARCMAFHHKEIIFHFRSCLQITLTFSRNNPAALENCFAFALKPSRLFSPWIRRALPCQGLHLPDPD